MYAHCCSAVTQSLRRTCINPLLSSARLSLGSFHNIYVNVTWWRKNRKIEKWSKREANCVPSTGQWFPPTFFSMRRDGTTTFIWNEPSAPDKSSDKRISSHSGHLPPTQRNHPPLFLLLPLFYSIFSSLLVLTLFLYLSIMIIIMIIIIPHQ